MLPGISADNAREEADAGGAGTATPITTTDVIFYKHYPSTFV
jgi:hypothetical protein